MQYVKGTGRLTIGTGKFECVVMSNMPIELNLAILGILCSLKAEA
jgi:hypothetical protein